MIERNVPLQAIAQFARIAFIAATALIGIGFGTLIYWGSGWFFWAAAVAGLTGSWGASVYWRRVYEERPRARGQSRWAPLVLLLPRGFACGAKFGALCAFCTHLLPAIFLDGDGGILLFGGVVGLVVGAFWGLLIALVLALVMMIRPK